MKRFLNFRFLLLFALMLSLSFTNADAQRRRSRSSSSSVRIVTSSNTISQAGRYLLDGDYYVGIIKREGGYTNIRATPNGRIVAKIKDGSKIIYCALEGDSGYSPTWREVYTTSGKYLGWVHDSKIVYYSSY